jgi:hypothetical protein
VIAIRVTMDRRSAVETDSIWFFRMEMSCFDRTATARGSRWNFRAHSTTSNRREPHRVEKAFPDLGDDRRRPAIARSRHSSPAGSP